MKRAREEDDEASAAVPEETGSPVARPSQSEDEPGAIADRRGVPTADLDPEDRDSVERARALQALFRQPFFVAEAFTGTPGAAPRLRDTLDRTREAIGAAI